MPLISAVLLKNLIDFDDTLNNTNGNSNMMRKMDLMEAFNKYAKPIFPISNTADAAKMAGIAAFQGDDPNVPYSFTRAWGTALGAYTPILAAGMIPQMYLPTLIPQSGTVIPGLMSVQSVQDKVSQVQILSQVIDAWMHTGISTLTIPPTVSVPTPWM